MSFAFPEVRAYKLSILKELIDNYAIDGLLSWIGSAPATCGTTRRPIRRHGNSGYEQPLVDEFKKRYGDRSP
jgi:hypothetical protein